MKQISTVFLALILTMAVSNSGCGGTSTGNPQIYVQSYNPFIARLFNFFIPSAHATLTSVTLCIKRFRLKIASGNTGGNVDYDIGLVNIDVNGTFLGEATIGPGSYERIEFDLNDKCTSGESIRVVNDQGSGTHTSTDTVTIKFDGNFTVTEDTTQINLGIQDIMDQMDADLGGIDSGAVKTAAEAASGDVL